MSKGIGKGSGRVINHVRKQAIGTKKTKLIKPAKQEKPADGK